MADVRASSDPFVGRTIDDKIVIESVIGTGGMGAVYKAQHKTLGKTVAIKVLSAASARDSNSILRFKLEAASLNALDHPNIVKVFSFGVLDERTENAAPYLVLEYLDGGSVIEKISAGNLSLDQCWNLLSQLASGLAAAHEKKIVHRDLKPSNLLFSENVLKIVDFGIAKSLSGEEQQKLTQTGAILGTPLYMSPEQLAGESPGTESDIYSVGCVLFEMLYGRRYVDGVSVIEIAMNQMSADRTMPGRTASGETVPKGLRALLAKMLEPNRADRIADATKLLEWIAMVRAKPDSSPEQLKTKKVWRPRRFKVVHAWIILGVIIGIGLAAPLLQRHLQADQLRGPVQTNLAKARTSIAAALKGGPEWTSARKAIQAAIDCNQLERNEEIDDMIAETLRFGANRRLTRREPASGDELWFYERAAELPAKTPQHDIDKFNYYSELAASHAHWMNLAIQGHPVNEFDQLNKGINAAERAMQCVRDSHFKIAATPVCKVSYGDLAKGMTELANISFNAGAVESNPLKAKEHFKSALRVSHDAVEMIEKIPDEPSTLTDGDAQTLAMTYFNSLGQLKEWVERRRFANSLTEGPTAEKFWKAKFGKDNWWSPHIWIAECSLTNSKDDNAVAEKLFLDLLERLRLAKQQPFQISGIYQLLGRACSTQGKLADAVKYHDLSYKWCFAHPDVHFNDKWRQDCLDYKADAVKALNQ
jgi:serine/threonine protein kinase